MKLITFLTVFLSGYTIEYKPVSGYTVEKKARGRGKWQAANAFPVDATNFAVTGLNEGSVYEFRVVAVNDAGPGKPSKCTEPHTARDPVCEYTMIKAG